MIFCTHYCPINLFFVSACYWFHSVPGGSTCKNEMVLFVTIAIAKCCIILFNAITHTVYSYKLSCFFVSVCCWVYLVPCGFNSFQVVSVSPNSFQLVFNSFPRISMYATRWPPPFSYFCRLKSCDHVTVLPCLYIRTENLLNEYKFF